MNQDLKSIIREEYIRCAESPVHFMKKYTFIQHPQRGRVLFNLYPFQEKTLNLFQENPYSIVLKSRQLGISTLAAGYSLWLMLFHKDKNVLCIATKQETAKNMVTKVKFMFDNLPSWLKIPHDEHNKLTLRLNNGSQIKATAASPDAGRSEAVSLLIIDEAAFIEQIGEIWASAQQTLATGGGAIVLSTPYGTGNWFHQTWTKSENRDNDFLPIKLPWYVHPERDEAWRKRQDELLGDPRLAAQECFSGNTIVYTKLGPKYIKDINIGEYVLSHDGTYNEVIRLYNHLEPNPVQIKGGLNNIQKFTTNNHPFLNENNEWEEVKSITNTKHKVKYFPTTNQYNKPTSQIDLSNYIISNSPSSFPLKIDNEYIWLTKTSKINRFIDIDYDLGFLIGCFLSEGSLAKNKVEFSFNGKTERNGFPLELERILLEKFNIDRFSYYTSKVWEGSSKLYIKDQIFNNFIKLCIQGGEKCYNKHISSFLYSISNEDTLKGILDGVLVGDGMLKSEYNISLLLTSEKLIYDVLYISNVLGIHNVSIKQGKSQNPNKPTWKPNYTLTWTNSILDSNEKIFSKRIETWERINTTGKSNSNSNFNFDGSPYVSIKIEQHNEPIEVFNIEVDKTHTYVTEYGIVHNCDCDFNTSGDIVFHSEWLDFIKETTIQEPLVRRGADQNLWVWEPADYSREYMVIADVARGDGKDSSACHVIDIATNTQVAEYKGQLPPKDYGYFLVGLASEYNNALLVVENASIGWATLDAIIERGYRNLYHSPKSDHYTVESYMKNYDGNSDLTPGFTLSLKTRPLVINKFREYIGDQSVTIRSKRLLGEMKVFIWKNGRPEAQTGYNDDLVMSFGIGMYLRDTSLKFQQQSHDMTRATLGGITKTTYLGGYNPNTTANPYTIQTGYGNEDISWLI
jgi:hypothetical protein